MRIEHDAQDALLKLRSIACDKLGGLVDNALDVGGRLQHAVDGGGSARRHYHGLRRLPRH